MGVKLTDAHTFETLFFKTFDVTQVSGQIINDNVEAIAPDPKYLFANWDDLLAKFDDSVAGLYDSEGLIAAHVAQRLKPAAAAQSFRSGRCRAAGCPRSTLRMSRVAAERHRDVELLAR